MDERQIVTGRFFVPRGDPSVVFDAVDEPLDPVAKLVFSLVITTLGLAVAAGRNHRFCLTLMHSIQEFIRIIAFIRNHRLRLMLPEKLFRTHNVVLLAGAKAKFQRLSLRVYGQVQFCAESAAATAERFVGRPFFWEPAAC